MARLQFYPRQRDHHQGGLEGGAMSEGTATVAVSTNPDGADIYADGVFVGNAPANLKLPAGKHTIRVSQSEYKDWSREITVQAGAESRLIATLEKK